MNIFNSSTNLFLFPKIFLDEVYEINSYNYKSNCIDESFPTISDKNNDEFKFDNIPSNFNFYANNSIFQDNLTKAENQIEIDNIFINELSYKETENKIVIFSKTKDNNENNIEYNKPNNINNVSNNNTNNNNIIIGEEKKENQKKDIFKVSYSNNLNIFNIFNKGNNDNISSYMIYEDFDMDKNCNSFPKKQKRKKYIKKRKDNADNIRKKIKSRFLKALKNAINQKLKNAGSKYFFNLLPQSFIINLSKEKNKEILDLSLKDIFLKDFNIKEKGKRADINKYKNNIFVLNYLEKNNDISEKSNFNIIKNMKYSEIFNEYLLSKEFEKEISTLKEEKENDKYIKDYIIKAKNMLNFFSC